MSALPSRWKPVLLFLLLLLFFPAIGSVAAWWRGETLNVWQWLGVLAFPLLAWLWLRHFSILGCRNACMPSPRGRE